jgi:hypothetical protein
LLERPALATDLFCPPVLGVGEQVVDGVSKGERTGAEGSDDGGRQERKVEDPDEESDRE